MYKPYPHQVDLFAARDEGIRHLFTRWHRRCFIGTTPIAMADGSWKNIKDILVGDVVLSYNNGKLEPKKVLEVFDNGEQEVIEYNDLTCTPNHRVLTVHGTYKEIQKTDHLINARTLRPELIKIGNSYLAATYDITVEGNHNYIANGYIVHNSGKDLTFWNLLIREAVKRKGIYYYVFPQLKQGKKALFEGITNDGVDFMDYIPKELREGEPNATEMKVRLSNGALIQIIGTDKYDKVRGTNPVGVVYSEYAFQNPGCREVIRPIILGNGGWEAFNSTPNGKNHMFHLEKNASKKIGESVPVDQRWFISVKTIEDTFKPDGTPLFSQEMLQSEREEGYSEEFLQQEYYVSYNANAQGYYFLNEMNDARAEGRIGIYPWDPDLPVTSYWDIGVGDSTAIWLMQWQDKNPVLIDFYSSFSAGIDHYASVLTNGKRARYTYRKHVFPHDMINTEFGTGKTRVEIAESLFGREKVDMGPKLGFDDGIQALRSFLRKARINECEETQPGIEALENYQREWNDERKEFAAKPRHDWASHPCDAARYMAIDAEKPRDRTKLTKRLKEFRRKHNKSWMVA